MRIAIVESEPAAADLLTFVAQRRGHQPVCVPTVGRLFERLPFEPTAAIVSFQDMDGEGLDGLARLRKSFPELTILVIAEKASTVAPIAVLRAGAQDVIQSPYNPFEVLLRLEGWVDARPQPQASISAVSLGDLEVDLEAYTAVKHGQQLPLTKLERRLLFCLCQHHPNVAPIERLLVFGWDALDDPDAGLLKTHISHIRTKLRDAGGVPFDIISHQTVGYSVRALEATERAS